MSNAVRVSKATFDDCQKLSEVMRKEDVLEVFHASRISPLDSLQNGLRESSECFVIYINDQPMVITGVVDMGGFGLPWALCAEGSDAYKKSLVKIGRKLVKRWMATYGCLANRAWAKNTSHLKLIKAYGFTLGATQVVNGEPFIQFYK